MFSQLFSILLASFVYAQQHRSKRIINGETIDSWDTSYNAMRYLASIGTLHRYLWAGVVADGDDRCGGAYISPTVVQTACHCLAVFQTSEDKDVLPASGHHPWENIMYVYIGVDKEFGLGLSMYLTKPSKSKAFLLHQACARLAKRDLEIYTSDYGWVIIDPGLDPKVLNVDRVSFAPQYELDEMTKIWEYFQQSRPMCLHLGFGQNEQNVYASEVLRLGWINLESYVKCASVTGKNVKSRNLITWICTVPFSNHNQSLAFGDVGGPLMCNNLYFGVAAGWQYDFDFGSSDDIAWDHQFLNYDNPLVFAVYENALEWRAAFLNFIDQLGKLPLCDLICNMTLSPNRVIDTFGPVRLNDREAYSCAQNKNFFLPVSLTIISLVPVLFNLQ